MREVRGISESLLLAGFLLEGGQGGHLPPPPLKIWDGNVLQIVIMFMLSRIITPISINKHLVYSF